jgi:hypothetical protein
MAVEDFRLSLDGGKYTIVHYQEGGLKILRYGEEWRDETGDSVIYLLAAHLKEAFDSLHFIAWTVPNTPWGKSAQKVLDEAQQTATPENVAAAKETNDRH